MPAQPLSDEQLTEAALLKRHFKLWQAHRRAQNLDFSQEFASDCLGFNQSSVSQYLNGKIPLNPDAASKFAKLLGIPVKEFSPRLADQVMGYAELAVAPSTPKSIADLDKAEIQMVLMLRSMPQALRNDLMRTVDRSYSVYA